MISRITGFLAAIAMAATLAVSPAHAQKAPPITITVSSSTGGLYDMTARLWARHLGRFLQGEPQVIVQNMPGAGSLRATNFLYTTAPRDGLTIGAFARDMPLMGIMGGNSNVQFDPRKFTWLRSASSSATVQKQW